MLVVVRTATGEVALIVSDQKRGGSFVAYATTSRYLSEESRTVHCTVLSAALAAPGKCSNFVVEEALVRRSAQVGSSEERTEVAAAAWLEPAACRVAVSIADLGKGHTMVLEQIHSAGCGELCHRNAVRPDIPALAPVGKDDGIWKQPRTGGFRCWQTWVS